jgi:competence protein ComEA
MSQLAPRSQWVAIMLLATLICSILLMRFYRKALPPSDIPPIPLMVAVEGDIERPGSYLMEGPEVRVDQVIEAAGGLQNGIFNEVLGDSALVKIRNGQLVRVACSGAGPVEIRVETMPAAARLTLGERLDLNTAMEEELMLVPQMKAGFAAAIINRRSRQEWQQLDELEEISGVGPKTVEKWRSYLEVNRNSTGGEHGTKR